MIELHLGMCRSAALSLNLRPQWGHRILSSVSGLTGGGGGKSDSATPLAIALETFRPCLTAAWKASWSRFHLGILCAGISSADVREVGRPTPAVPPRDGAEFSRETVRVCPIRPRVDCGAGELFSPPSDAPSVALSRRCCESHGRRCAELTVIFWQISRCTSSRSAAKLRPQHGHGVMSVGRSDGSSSYGSSPIFARACAAESGESGRPSLPSITCALGTPTADSAFFIARICRAFSSSALAAERTSTQSRPPSRCFAGWKVRRGLALALFSHATRCLSIRSSAKLRPQMAHGTRWIPPPSLATGGGTAFCSGRSSRAA
mmetsp:Transcript_15892/g.39829  ORF Transcript_15892/g.39829 Transcript_15892/m.39829 type:complete len:319 (+) Transcript_15892:515-1471(+)